MKLYAFFKKLSGWPIREAKANPDESESSNAIFEVNENSWVVDKHLDYLGINSQAKRDEFWGGYWWTVNPDCLRNSAGTTTAITSAALSGTIIIMTSATGACATRFDYIFKTHSKPLLAHPLN